MKEVYKHRVPTKNISINLIIIDILAKGLLSRTFIEHVEKITIIDNKDC